MEDSQENVVQQPFNTTEQSGPTAAEAGRIAELEAQLAQARQEAAANWSKYLRERADWDNFRKRQDRVLADRIQQQKKALFTKLLDVMDNVERALQYQDTLDKPQLQQTLRMFNWQMNEVLRGEGLNPVVSVGETFQSLSA